MNLKLRTQHFKLLFAFALLFSCNPAFADISSTNYSINSSEFSSGGKSQVQSTAYKMDSNILNAVSGSAVSSTNYGLEMKTAGPEVGLIPEIQSVNPDDLARFYTDESASFTVTASTPDSDPLQYEAKQGSTTKDGPQVSSALNWSLGASDKGKHNLDLKVIDPDGTVNKQQGMYVFRRPLK